MLVLDSHCHIYSVHDPLRAIEYAVENLASHKQAIERSQVAVALTEWGEATVFKDLLNGSLCLAKFDCLRTSEDNSIVIRHENSELIVYAGRQINTAERLEVLALGVGDDLGNDLSLEEGIRATLERGGIPILPWSLGKWLGKRRAHIERALTNFGPESLFLGDNSIRPRGLPEPMLFSVARRAGYAVLAGSDPLPVEGDERFMGSFASTVPLMLDEGKPFDSLRRALTSSSTNARARISSVGQRRHPIQVVKSQILLRAKK